MLNLASEPQTKVNAEWDRFQIRLLSSDIRDDMNTERFHMKTSKSVHILLLRCYEHG